MCHFSRMHWVCVCVRWMATCRTHTHAHTHTRTYTHTYTHTQHTNIHTHRWSKGDTRLWLLVTTCCSVLQCVAVCCSVSTGVTKPGLLVTILESQPIPKFTIRDSFGAGFSKKLPCEPSSTFTRTTTAFQFNNVYVSMYLYIYMYVCMHIYIYIYE